MSYLYQIPNRILTLFYYISMTHAITSYVALPVDSVKIFILSNPGDIILHIRRAIE